MLKNRSMLKRLKKDLMLFLLLSGLLFVFPYQVHCQTFLNKYGKIFTCGCNTFGNNSFLHHYGDSLIEIGNGNWRDFTTSYSEFLALKNDGSIWMKGSNEHGQLGLGDFWYNGHLLGCFALNFL
jgi:hypothetical protein